MAVLIDPPRWPAHGTQFSHLVSDESLEELHAFAAAAGIPPRAFDHDHYDVPERRYADLVARGAIEVPESELVRRLVKSGLRLRSQHRTPKVYQVLPDLIASWERLLPGRDRLGAELIERWREPHRHYHDVRHLAQCLTALHLITDAAVPRTVELAAWFHDAVYERSPGRDEEDSAQLAERLLPRAGLANREVAEVSRLVLVTAHHAPDPADLAGSQLVDADLSILGQSRGRYHVYVRDVRLEYDHLDDETFRLGRLQVVEGLIARDPLYRTGPGTQAWAARARANLDEERARWLG